MATPSNGDPDLIVTAVNEPRFQMRPRESKAAYIADDYVLTEAYIPSAEAQLLADEAAEEAEREYTRADLKGFGLRSLMSRVRRFAVESEAPARDFEGDSGTEADGLAPCRQYSASMGRPP